MWRKKEERERKGKIERNEEKKEERERKGKK